MVIEISNAASGDAVVVRSRCDAVLQRQSYPSDIVVVTVVQTTARDGSMTKQFEMRRRSAGDQRRDLDIRAALASSNLPCCCLEFTDRPEPRIQASCKTRRLRRNPIFVPKSAQHNTSIRADLIIGA